MRRRRKEESVAATRRSSKQPARTRSHPCASVKSEPLTAPCLRETLGRWVRSLRGKEAEDCHEREALKVGKQWVAGELTVDEVAAKLDEIRKPHETNGTLKRAPLTIRTIDEILGMTFDPADLILPNGYLTAGDLTAICGMGGVGKSRLVMQFALCCRSSRDFLGWQTNGRDLRFLFLQTENSCRRLKDDLVRLLSAFKPEEQKHITPR